MFSPQEKENLCMVTKSKMLFCFGECCCPTGSSTQPTCNLIPWKRLCREIKLFVYTSLPYECWLYTHVTALNRVSHKLHLHWKSQQIMGKPLFGTTSGGLLAYQTDENCYTLTDLSAAVSQFKLNNRSAVVSQMHMHKFS